MIMRMVMMPSVLRRLNRLDCILLDFLSFFLSFIVCFFLLGLFILFTIVVSLMYLVPGDNISSEPEEPKEPEEDEEDDEGVGDFRLFLLFLVFGFFLRSLLGEQFPPEVCASRAT
jgi:hypothetical protein